MTSPAPRRILLHVGSPKCGSTYLQRVMLRNAAVLEAAGLRYPHDGGAHPGNAAGLAGIDRPTLERHFAGGIHTLILSHEDLFPDAGRGAALARLAAEDGTALQVVTFLRPFSEMVYGDFSQFMKQNFGHYLAARQPYEGMDFEAFVQARARVLTPAAFLARWQALIPGRPIRLDHHRRIRPVIETLLGEVPGFDWRVPRGEANLSLRMEDCDRIAGALRDPGRSPGEVRTIFKAAFARTGEPDAGRSPERTARIETVFAAETRALQRRFGFGNALAPAEPA